MWGFTLLQHSRGASALGHDDHDTGGVKRVVKRFDTNNDGKVDLNIVLDGNKEVEDNGTCVSDWKDKELDWTRKEKPIVAEIV